MAVGAGSVWAETVKRQIQPKLEDNIKTDVLVIGGGMCGILTAHMLKEAGADCVVVEAEAVGGGITKNTTAKISAQHGLVYTDLIKRAGLEKAKQYYEAATCAINNFRALSEKYPCDFEDKTAYVYSTDHRRKIEDEAQAYHRLGLPSRIQESPPLPFKTAGAIAMEKQAQFHPLKLLYALAEEARVYENTFIRKIEGRAAYAETGKITAGHIVLATHFPLINIPGLYFLKLYQHRSYVIALEGAPLIDGMYLDEREEGHSFRTFGDLLFIGGGDHKTGKKGGGYAELRELAARAYPKAREKYHWAAQDCMTLDKIPYIGRHRAGSKDLYAASGFNKWGMTGSMVAAKLLTDLIMSGKSELEELYAPGRSMMSLQLAVNIASAAKGLLSLGGPRCSHMGCKLHWNNAEQSFDCSCHGSRFDKKGRIINSPAKKRIRL